MAKDRFGFDTNREGVFFLRRPELTRRLLFRHGGSALGGYFLMNYGGGEPARAAVAPVNTARYCVFVNMQGGPSHSDLFDLKEGAWTPAAFAPTNYGDIRWPQGLMPKLAEQIGSISLVRSMRSWTGVHSLGQSWMQIGRNPALSQSKFAPHIGSIASIELADRTKPLPAFLALNPSDMPGSGYLPPENGPFGIAAGGAGLPNSTFSGGAANFARRYDLMQMIDAEERLLQKLGSTSQETVVWNAAARRLMYNEQMNAAFTASAAERARYGNSTFGTACITARNLISADLGARFIQINVGGWDNHAGIYTGALNAGNANSTGRLFDAALGTLIADLASAGLLDRTLIVGMGEFGRTVGALNASTGRDHFQQQAVMLAGARLKGGRVIGSTDAVGSVTSDPGWSRARDVRPEDIEATIYSALGIDWTRIRHDDPLGRGFYYVPDSDKDLYGPIDELWI
jgi:hypothetical protein